ncbi:MAG: hypothetical protein D6811_03260, partial [Alphaproteobacteria bacterium]
MSTLAAVMDRAARRCSVSPPSDWIAATSDDHVELRDDILAATVDDLRARVDWPAPIGKQSVIAGDGSEEYSLPSDFSRVHGDPPAVYETAGFRRVCTPVASVGEWTAIKAS